MHVEHSIQIEAPHEIVWRVTVDVERWSEWTPTVTSAQLVRGRPIGLGSAARIKQPAQPEAEWVVTHFEVGRRFEWVTRRRGLRVVGVHEMRPVAGGTQSVLRAEMSGPLALLLWPILRVLARHAIVQENIGLKRRSEQIARDAGYTVE